MIIPSLRTVSIASIMSIAVTIFLLLLLSHVHIVNTFAINIHPNADATIKGTINLEGYNKSFTNANLYLYVDDISYQDSPAKTIYKKVMNNVSRFDNEPINFTMSIPSVQNINTKHIYMLRLLLDTGRDNGLSKGDFVNIDLNRILLCSGCVNNFTTTLSHLQ